LQIFDKNGKEIEETTSSYDDNFIYKKWKTIHPSSREENRWIECAWGIHFFVTRIEAECYNI
jgi:hypothetical protein